MDLDRLDSELIDDVLRMPGWALIATRLGEEHTRKTRALIESGENPEVTRGFILGLETAMKIPKIIAQDARGKNVHTGR